jgi:hypothetical protein
LIVNNDWSLVPAALGDESLQFVDMILTWFAMALTAPRALPDK